MTESWESLGITIHVFTPMGEDEIEEFMGKVVDLAVEHFGKDEEDIRFIVSSGNVEAACDSWDEFIPILTSHYGASRIIIPNADS